jgi:hypothetical protein
MEETKELKTNHNARVAILSTGERILCLFGEVRADDDKVIGYKLLYPYALTLGTPQDDGNIPINYARWCPYSPVQEYRVNGEHIVSVTFPDNKILDNYVTELESFGIPKDQLFYEVDNGDNSEPDQAAE